jgi:hypothetical protein
VARTFLSPEERRILANLPPREAIFVKRVMDTFDAVLVEGETKREPDATGAIRRGGLPASPRHRRYVTSPSASTAEQPTPRVREDEQMTFVDDE